MDDETPTPRLSRADTLAEACSVLAARLDLLALRRRKNLLCLDLEGAARAARLAERAVRLAGLFAGWSASPEREALERRMLGEDLRALTAEADAELRGSGV